MNMRMVLAGLTLSVAAGQSIGAQHEAMPPGLTHEQHLATMTKEAALKARGNRTMGFDQDKTTHHFLLTADGGTIRVDVNTTDDHKQRDLIRLHLRDIARDFGKGIFEAPVATHDEVPPGVAAMQRLGSAVGYRFEETSSGGQVRIRASSQEAVSAVHAFLTYQIREHRTGDPLTIR